ncbi:MAG: hypothetical protein IPO01_00255 [Chitinophagaceae bacterium]|nr:hypothetical protein [Chitinophagaceae bacterium]
MLPIIPLLESCANQPSNTNGSNNTAVGNLALNLNTNGISNVAIGANALEKGRGIFNHFNVAVGVQALQNDSTSFGGNTGIGFQSRHRIQVVSIIFMEVLTARTITR